jgi:hypothetical protein
VILLQPESDRTVRFGSEWTATEHPLRACSNFLNHPV